MYPTTCRSALGATSPCVSFRDSRIAKEVQWPFRFLYLRCSLGIEADNSLLADCIKVAEESIERRLWKLPKLQETEEERELAERVLANLAVLRQERLRPPARRA